MLNLQQIHKPTKLQDALTLLQKPGTVALAGGTNLIAKQRRDVNAVVDLSGLGLAFIRESAGTIVLGATTTLAALDESPILRALASGVIAQAAHRSVSSVLRNQATIAGTLIAEPDGILAVALLACDARVTIVGAETRVLALADFLGQRDTLGTSLVTEIAVPMTNAHASIQTVARTPSDKPIVSVCASVQIVNGVARDVRVALGGVNESAMRASQVEKQLEGKSLNADLVAGAAQRASQGLAPLGDFRGSVEYRTEMAVVLSRRAVNELIA